MWRIIHSFMTHVEFVTHMLELHMMTDAVFGKNETDNDYC